MHKKSDGFTLMELMIVAVIIGLLAAVTTAVYSNLQQRAHNTLTVAIANDWHTVLTTYYTVGGSINATDIPEWHSLVCLGDTVDYPARDGFAAGSCIKGADTKGSAVVSADVTGLTSLVAKPGVPTSPVKTSETVALRGIRYRDLGSGQIEYTLIGKDQDCQLAAAKVDSGHSGGSHTACVIPLQLTPASARAITGFSYPDYI